MNQHRLNSGSARSFLVTILGEFMMGADASAVWTTSILDALAGIGFNERASRQALNRVRDAGWLASEKAGRRTRWSITQKGREFVSAGSRQVRALQDTGEAWDGRWLVVHVSMPEAMRPDRLKLYRVLGWQGFGNPSPTMWVSPHADKMPALREAMIEYGAKDHAIAFVGTISDIGIDELTLVDQSWDHAAIRAHYESLLAEYSATGTLTDADYLATYLQLVNAFQRLPSLDPRLPARLMDRHPSNRESLEKLVAVRQAMRPRAHAIWTKMNAD